MIKKFTIFKAKNQKTEKSPSHNMVFIDDTKKGNDKYVYVGVCWTKQGANGQAFLSCQMNDKFNDKQGYQIISDKELQDLQATKFQAQDDASFTPNVNDEVDNIPF